MTSLHEQEEILAPYFDPVFYVSSYPDIEEKHLSPLRHFIKSGWRDRRNPNRWFDVDYYLRMNLDVAESGINPLLHYVWAGRSEGRRPCREMDAERRQLQAARPASIRAMEWACVADDTAPGDGETLVATLCTSDAAGLAIAISHDDYSRNYGGVQKLIGDEAREFGRAGWDYLHLSPAAPLPILAAAAGDGFRVVARRNGERLGVFRLGHVADAVARVVQSGRRAETLLHHLMGWSTEAVAILTEAARSRPIFWAHDFFSLCPSYTLMRNDVAFCGAPPPASNACQLCVNGADRTAQAPRMAAFFARTRPFVLAPSASAFAVWRTGGLAHEGHAVVPLGRLALDGVGQVAGPTTGPVRIAHLGARVLFKGWGVFETLAREFAADPRYQFFQLGVDGHTPRIGAIRHIPVQVTTGTPDAMIDAVARHRIDVVVSWSVWPETFCFAAHEAVAAGAALIVHSAAGNVPSLARELGDTRALVLNDAAALRGAFAGDVVTALARSEGRRYGVILPSAGSADWLLKRRHPRPTIREMTHAAD